MATLIMTDSQQTTVTFQAVDRKGNPAAIDGMPTWMVDKPAVLALTPSTDGKSCLVAAVGPLGDALVSVTADADMGAGVTPIAGTLDVTVIAGAASSAALTATTPVEQP